MRLLLTNDDGIFAPGISALALELSKYHDVTIVAPDTQRSGAGHSFTCTSPLCMYEVTLTGLEHVKAYSLSGTPVDCAKIGCHNLDIEIDAVVSGINHGSNLGSDVLYSGTVGGAMEGALLGKQAVAVSCYAHAPKDFSSATWAAKCAVDYIEQNPLKPGHILNVNAPDCSREELKGVKVAPLCLQEYDNKYAQYTAPSGAKYFFVPFGKLTKFGDDDHIDERYVREGYATVTPLGFDLGDHAHMKQMDISAFFSIGG